MRGLDIRVRLAQSRIMALLDENAAWHMWAEAESGAWNQGRVDAASGIDEVPLLFQGEKELVSAWNFGYWCEVESTEMSHCPECEGGNPCPLHG